MRRWPSRSKRREPSAGGEAAAPSPTRTSPSPLYSHAAAARRLATPASAASTSADDRDRASALVEFRRITCILPPANAILIVREQAQVIRDNIRHCGIVGFVQPNAKTHAAKLRQNVAIVQPLSVLAFTKATNHDLQVRRKLAWQVLSARRFQVLICPILFSVGAEDADLRRTDGSPVAACPHARGDHLDEARAIWSKVRIDEDDVPRDSKHASHRFRDGLRRSRYGRSMLLAPPTAEWIRPTRRQPVPSDLGPD